MTKEQIEKVFTYYPPTKNQIPRYEIIRNLAKEFALQLCAYCPDSAEKTLAIRKLQECVMYANASIAINEKEETNGKPN